MSYAEVVLVRAGAEVRLGRVGAGTRCDLGLVEDLLLLQLTFRRFGWSLRLDDVDDRLRELVDLVGLSTELGT
ncbi:MAG: hypothetical protein ABWZ76_01825 [Acidimicrobiales bacterium]